MSSDIIMITGGIKSGKSAFALSCGERDTKERAFVATACALDDDMQERILLHRKERGERWKTFEEARDIAGLIEKINGVFDVIVVDCLTMWVSNLLTIYTLTRQDIDYECKRLVDAVTSASSRIILVTNEVGMGIIPADDLARSYQHALGMVNRRVARAATNVYLLVAGVPLKMK
ncbi:MAG: bifunctional adenosylcobinamide kinase/adenosylcobinamide-phosphate guanylyltransferase [Desulfobacterota bacterium]|nr:bifunctional adenosylcobinamide kinase/adenosylcobinamide-phosphate guanylyltransferase [Thermodesulfobacteriota bacterium]